MCAASWHTYTHVSLAFLLDSIWIQDTCSCQVDRLLQSAGQQSVHNTGQVCHLSVYLAMNPPVVLVAGVCRDCDRLKLVREYVMPTVTHPIVPLTLV